MNRVIGDKQIGWANIYIIMNQTSTMKSKILLDSGASKTLFCNKEY